jgi:hypothetical protein
MTISEPYDADLFGMKMALNRADMVMDDLAPGF